jgi:hypothetical protein
MPTLGASFGTVVLVDRPVSTALYKNASFETTIVGPIGNVFTSSG